MSVFLGLFVTPNECMGAGTKRPSAEVKRLGEYTEQSVANRPKGNRD